MIKEENKVKFVITIFFFHAQKGFHYFISADLIPTLPTMELNKLHTAAEGNAETKPTGF